MIQAFVITLREGLEAFLIVAISLAYLKKTGRTHLASAVRWGIVVSVVVSIGAGMLLSEARNQALWEAVLAMVAAVSVTTLVVHMWRTGQQLKRRIEGHLEAYALQAGAAAFLGVFGFAIGRYPLQRIRAPFWSPQLPSRCDRKTREDRS